MADRTPPLVTILAALILGGGFAIGAYFIADGLVNLRSYDNYVTVKGVAERDVEADLVIWPIKHAATGDDLPTVQKEVEASSQKVISFLRSQGIEANDIVTRSIEVTDLLAQQYRPDNATTSRFIVSETLTVRSTNIDSIDKASQNIGDLLKQGVSLSRDSSNPGLPQYLYTKLNDLKPQMIADATKNARESAAQFAKDSGANVGTIRDANQGLFEIQPRDSSDPYAERSSRYKTVRVVATLKFYLD